MTLLVLGLALWIVPHWLKRMAPDLRAGWGDKAKGPLALAMVLGIVLMVLGYRAADGAFLWGRSPAMVGINNLLMLASVYLFAAAGMKTAIARKMRHPMLWATVLWAASHLLVNGDVPSFVLFGGIGVWALVSMALINRAGPWVPPPAKPAKFEAMALAGSLLFYGALAGVHTALGYPTFG
ncbi:NnrU family protein [Tabrizicola sp.]|uniref:NnrU family protein n=1 Tax=Tabrizicola sp. TaxID=2005166 RepID=UPI003D290FFC